MIFQPDIRAENEVMFEFAIAVAREAAIRSGVFKPATPQEHAWALAGRCRPFEMSAVQRELLNA